jgi:pyridoxal phosphate enzyme (YggS family)
MPVSDNIRIIRQRIGDAAQRAARRTEDITLMAVSKTFSSTLIREAYATGLRCFGESRVQEFAGKIEDLRDLEGAEWRMIGHLQANKAAKAVELFSGVDSVDSLRLALRLNGAAAQRGGKIPILIEINIAGEQAKSGAAPGSKELEEILSGAEELESLNIRGLMTVPPYGENPEEARPYFRRLRELRDRIAGRHLPRVGMSVSHDFEVAIEEGSTCVRVGTAIFGDRN